jgi:hypothetical protein
VDTQPSYNRRAGRRDSAVPAGPGPITLLYWRRQFRPESERILCTSGRAYDQAEQLGVGPVGDVPYSCIDDVPETWMSGVTRQYADPQRQAMIYIHAPLKNVSSVLGIYLSAVACDRSTDSRV